MNKSGQKKSFKSVESVGDKNYIEYYHKMPRILLTGFEPFGRYNLNSSWELVTALPDTIGNFKCIKLYLPVEFNASSRALGAISEAGLLYEDELPGAQKTLSAAALTYVAALMVALAQFLRLLMIFGRRRDD